MNNYCSICNSYDVTDTWTVRIKDDNNTVEYSGHKKCVDDLHEKISNVKGLDKKSVDKALKEIGLYNKIK